MKAILIGTMLMACAVATPEHESMFADFKTAHARKYASKEEELKRFRVFSANMKRAEELNRSNPLARFGANAYADMSATEFKSRHRADRKANSRKRSATPIEYSASELYAAAGKQVDWRAKGAVTGVKDQGQCGSCWAFSTTGGIEGQWFLAGNPLTSLSEQELVSCDDFDSACEGGLTRRALEWIVGDRKGEIATEASYPYTSGYGNLPACSTNLASKTVGAVVTGQRDIAQNEDQMAAFVYSSGPLSIAVNASIWQLYSGGVVTNCPGGDMDHEVLVVGFDDVASTPYWIVKNSWSSSWGEAGYIRLQKGTNQCNVAGDPLTAIVKSATSTTAPEPTTTSTSTALDSEPSFTTGTLLNCEDSACLVNCSNRTYVLNKCLPNYEHGFSNFATCNGGVLTITGYPTNPSCTGPTEPTTAFIGQCVKYDQSASYLAFCSL